MSYKPTKLYVKGAFLGFRRSKVLQNTNQHLVKMEGVNTKKDAEFYFGKRVVYIYKAPTMKNGSHYRMICGKVMCAHGDNGVVRCIFRRNLPSTAIGKTVRVMLFPSRV
ncbi:hypothetical protein WA556_005820 [Blastocystis sp. ATCC 50177/Nand II]